MGCREPPRRTRPRFGIDARWHDHIAEMREALLQRLELGDKQGVTRAANCKQQKNIVRPIFVGQVACDREQRRDADAARNEYHAVRRCAIENEGPAERVKLFETVFINSLVSNSGFFVVS